jgi:hypothetical protein
MNRLAQKRKEKKLVLLVVYFVTCKRRPTKTKTKRKDKHSKEHMQIAGSQKSFHANGALGSDALPRVKQQRNESCRNGSGWIFFPSMGARPIDQSIDRSINHAMSKLYIVPLDRSLSTSKPAITALQFVV